MDFLYEPAQITNLTIALHFFLMGGIWMSLLLNK